jgi:hypothetical protein
VTTPVTRRQSTGTIAITIWNINRFEKRAAGARRIGEIDRSGASKFTGLDAGITLRHAKGDDGTREMFDEILEGEAEAADWLEGQLHTVDEIRVERYLVEQIHDGSARAALPDRASASQAPARSSTANPAIGGVECSARDRGGQMIEKKILADREKALEELFFEKENRKLLERIRAEAEQVSAKQGLADLTGIRDEALLEKLVQLGIRPGKWAALALIPLVEVAWADGAVEERERRAVLSAAEANGVAKDGAAHQLLEQWLAERPDAAYLGAWGEYIVDLCAELGEPERGALRQEILGRARQVAESAGGILGLGNKVSEAEQRALDELEKAFAD